MCHVHQVLQVDRYSVDIFFFNLYVSVNFLDRKK